MICMILCLAYVVDDGLKAFLVVDRECASTLSPPFLLALASWCATRGRMHKIGG